MARVKDRLLVANLVVMLMLVASSVAAHTGAVESGVIHACKLVSKGTLRLIGATDPCKSGEVELDWNGTGPQGPQGATGPQGPSGVVGTGYTFGLVGDLSNVSTETYTFLGPTLNVKAEQGQTIVVHGEAVLGTTGGAPSLRLAICRHQVGVDVTPVDNGNDFLTILPSPAGDSRSYSLSTAFKKLTTGTHTVGLCYWGGTTGSSWDYNGSARLTAMLVTEASNVIAPATTGD